MNNRLLGAVSAACIVVAQCLPSPGWADNAMGYQLLSQQDAERLPRNHGALGLDIARAQQITNDGMTFDIIRVTQVHRGSPGAKAGFKVGDDIIAVDGHVFASLAAFAAYVGATQPGSQITVDYIPNGGGPQQAQRVAVTIGEGSQAAESTGMSTGKKIAIGVGAAALLGCYEMGCFSHRSTTPTPGTVTR